MALIVFTLLLVDLTSDAAPIIIAMALKVTGMDPALYQGKKAIRGVLVFVTAMYFLVAAVVFVEGRCFAITTSVKTA